MGFISPRGSGALQDMIFSEAAECLQCVLTMALLREPVNMRLGP